MKEALIQIGLGAQEAEVYSMLARHYQSPAASIASVTKINRSVIYSIVESLKEKGLVSEILINGIKHFSVTKPAALMSYVKMKEEAAKTLMTSLDSLEKHEKENVKVEVYQGIQGGLSVLKDIIATGKSYSAFGEDILFQELFGTLAEQYIRQLEEKKIRERLLGPFGSKVLASRYSEVKYLPQGIKFPSISAIYGNKVAFAIFQKPYYAIVIESVDLAITYQSLFDYLWKISHKT